MTFTEEADKILAANRKSRRIFIRWHWFIIAVISGLCVNTLYRYFDGIAGIVIVLAVLFIVEPFVEGSL